MLDILATKLNKYKTQLFQVLKCLDHKDQAIKKVTIFNKCFLLIHLTVLSISTQGVHHYHPLCFNAVSVTVQSPDKTQNEK